jgi:hypothetical protein
MRENRRHVLLEWAAKHDSLEAIRKFLREVREDDWYHIGV